MSEIAEMIISLRKNEGMTQEELADKLFISRSLVSLWELGIRVPDYDNVVKLAHLFHVKESDIISAEEYLYCFEDEQKNFLKEIDDITLQTEALGDMTDINAVIREFLAGLRQKDRDIFISRYYQAKTNKAIALDFKMSESAVKVRLTRIRKKFKTFVERRTCSDK